MTGETELKRASDSFLKQIERLHALELEKRRTAPGTPEMLNLSRLVEEVAERVLGTAHRQEDLAERAATGEPARLRPIADVPPRPIPEVLGDWREAERALAAAEPGSVQYETAAADVDRLREEYRRAYELRAD